SEALPLVIGVNCDHAPAVVPLALIGPVRRRDQATIAFRFRFAFVDRVFEIFGPQNRRADFLLRAVDPLAEAGLLALNQRADNAESAGHAAHEIGMLRARL